MEYRYNEVFKEEGIPSGAKRTAEGDPGLPTRAFTMKMNGRLVLAPGSAGAYHEDYPFCAIKRAVLVAGGERIKEWEGFHLAAKYYARHGLLPHAAITGFAPGALPFNLAVTLPMIYDLPIGLSDLKLLLEFASGTDLVRLTAGAVAGYDFDVFVKTQNLTGMSKAQLAEVQEQPFYAEEGFKEFEILNATAVKYKPLDLDARGDLMEHLVIVRDDPAGLGYGVRSDALVTDVQFRRNSELFEDSVSFFELQERWRRMTRAGTLPGVVFIDHDEDGDGDGFCPVGETDRPKLEILNGAPSAPSTVQVHTVAARSIRRLKFTS